MKVAVIAFVIGEIWIILKGIVNGLEDNSNIKIGQNTEKSPGDLTRLAVLQIPVKDHQQKLAGKILLDLNNRVFIHLYGFKYFYIILAISPI